MKGNFFVGYNLGHNIYKMGFLCLIGIAHLPDSMNKLRFYRVFEVRPSFSTNINGSIEEELKSIPKHAGLVTKNLFSALKLICAKVLHKVPLSGNVVYEDHKTEEELLQEEIVSSSEDLYPE